MIPTYVKETLDLETGQLHLLLRSPELWILRLPVVL